MRLISYTDFGRLRLLNFLIGEMEIEPLAKWEFQEQRWVGERVGAFTEFLRLESEPDVLRVICLDLSVQPQKVWNAILNTIGLPLRHGQSLADVTQALGAVGVSKRGVGGRMTVAFDVGEREHYSVRCTFRGDAGLVFVALIRADSAVSSFG